MRNASSTGLTVRTEPETNINDEIEDRNLQTLASLHIFPEISPVANPNDIATSTSTDVESLSDDESDDGAVDTYLPLDNFDDSPDNNNDQAYMEEDGNYADFLRGISYNYADLNEELTAPVNMYNGRGPILCHGVTRHFKTVLEYVQVCGGMDYEFFKWIKVNSNQYSRFNMNDLGDFGGSCWTNITVHEMIRVHGVLLKMSVDNRELGGYKSYFT